MAAIRKGSRLGKYKIQGRIGSGGFGDVYRALDTVEGIRVALKVPLEGTTADALKDFQREIRLTAGLEHPNILMIKNADLVDGRLIVAYPLGEETLADRITRRISVEKVLDLSEQLLEALAYAHAHRIMHCDVKPENLILFEDDWIRLTDFGISRVAHATVVNSGSGTLGYMAPEQAMGRASFRSDVFSAGLVIWRMLSGRLPEWPFQWPPPGHQRVRDKIPRAMVDLLRKALEVPHRRRFADAQQMLTAYQRLLPNARRFLSRKRAGRRGRR